MSPVPLSLTVSNSLLLPEADEAHSLWQTAKQFLQNMAPPLNGALGGAALSSLVASPFCGPAAPGCIVLGGAAASLANSSWQQHRSTGHVNTNEQIANTAVNLTTGGFGTLAMPAAQVSVSIGTQLLKAGYLSAMESNVVLAIEHGLEQGIRSHDPVVGGKAFLRTMLTIDGNTLLAGITGSTFGTIGHLGAKAARAGLEGRPPSFEPDWRAHLMGHEKYPDHILDKHNVNSALLNQISNKWLKPTDHPQVDLNAVIQAEKELVAYQASLPPDKTWNVENALYRLHLTANVGIAQLMAKHGLDPSMLKNASDVKLKARDQPPVDLPAVERAIAELKGYEEQTSLKYRDLMLTLRSAINDVYQLVHLAKDQILSKNMQDFLTPHRLVLSDLEANPADHRVYTLGPTNTKSVHAKALQTFKELDANPAVDEAVTESLRYKLRDYLANAGPVVIVERHNLDLRALEREMETWQSKWPLAEKMRVAMRAREAQLEIMEANSTTPEGIRFDSRIEEWNLLVLQNFIEHVVKEVRRAGLN